MAVWLKPTPGLVPSHEWTLSFIRGELSGSNGSLTQTDAEFSAISTSSSSSALQPAELVETYKEAVIHYRYNFRNVRRLVSYLAVGPSMMPELERVENQACIRPSSLLLFKPIRYWLSAAFLPFDFLSITFSCALQMLSRWHRRNGGFDQSHLSIWCPLHFFRSTFSP